MKSLFAILRGKTDNFWVQLVRYTFVGGLAFVVDFGSLYLLTEYAGIHYLISAALAFGLGLATNYSISVLWVFNKRTVRNRGVELAIFALLGLIGLAVNELAMYLFTDVMGLFFMVSKIIATGGTYAWNFLSRKLILFSLSPEDREALLITSQALDLEAKA